MVVVVVVLAGASSTMYFLPSRVVNLSFCTYKINNTLYKHIYQLSRCLVSYINYDFTIVKYNIITIKTHFLFPRT